MSERSELRRPSAGDLGGGLQAGAPPLFVLAPPRSGTTLLRVMLAGHPDLFAPPELELLNFETLKARRDTYSGRDRFRLEGLVRAVMELRAVDVDEALRQLAEATESGYTTAELYRQMCQELAPRRLVDKTPTYAFHQATLRRAETLFDGQARYLHLVRHPGGAVVSFEKASLEQIFFPNAKDFSRRELAELSWLVGQQNILRFLDTIEPERQLRVAYEDLVTDPSETIEQICNFLDLAPTPHMLAPYDGTSQRMTDGLHAESRMLGDVKFHQHRKIDARAADRWRERLDEDELSELTWVQAAALGYRRAQGVLDEVDPSALAALLDEIEDLEGDLPGED